LFIERKQSEINVGFEVRLGLRRLPSEKREKVAFIERFILM
jgi:hypothetical protein